LLEKIKRVLHNLRLKIGRLNICPGCGRLFRTKGLTLAFTLQQEKIGTIQTFCKKCGSDYIDAGIRTELKEINLKLNTLCQLCEKCKKHNDDPCCAKCLVSERIEDLKIKGGKLLDG
jgi:hypothetical protein